MSMNLDVCSDVKGQLFLQVLQSFGWAKLRVGGSSMLSSIWPGDVLEVRRQSAAEISPGEVVLFARHGRLLAHRVVEKVGGQERLLLLTRGDRLSEPDLPVSPGELLGRVTAIQRGKRRIALRLTPWGRAASWILSRSDLCTRIILRLRRVNSEL